MQLQFFCRMEFFYKLDYFINTKLSTLSFFQKSPEEWQDQKDSCHSNQYKLKMAYLKVLINNQYRLLLAINQVYFFSSKEYLIRCNILAQLLSWPYCHSNSKFLIESDCPVLLLSLLYFLGWIMFAFLCILLILSNFYTL